MGWKSVERRLAGIFGTVRRGPLGGADFETDLLAVEVKSRKSLPAWLLGAVEQAERNARGKMPVVILHRVGSRYEDDLVIVRLGNILR